ncbi:MAG: hypothetical protein AAFO91_05225 [Bacteroidota bacterium]
MEKLGSTLTELSRLNHQVYFAFLKMLKVPNSQTLVSKDFELIQNDTEKWKCYALSLEKEIKAIQALRYEGHLKQRVLEGLDASSIHGRESRR